MPTRLKILIADDHAMLRDGLRLLLETTGFEVVAEAEDGVSAVALAALHAPDIAILDIAMPLRNGIDAAAHIRDAQPATRIVMLSAHASSEYIYRAFQAGALGYVLKDEAGQVLVAAIRAVLGGNRYLSSKIEEQGFDAYALRRSLADGRSPAESLSPRERAVLQQVCDGLTSAAIGEQLGLSPKTVETYRSRLMQKLGVTNVADLVKFAVRHGLTSA